ncbi:SAM-dependent methyltransferase [Lentzea sp. BCCO 10_0061]|uniref:SAM-dependent methyltransferase n=1 Tax=Lentzea sokolovensis TaxID=3095429 RepID=A0ABU4VCF3_9PSEU|nr:SAM-dependent methyltransferase [Lentzea sp. BCCO 10_0061]MDX8149486.1 SAM-dependent methyltransferase [Lentzea sp. BCCO 10_0061]
MAAGSGDAGSAVRRVIQLERAFLAQSVAFMLDHGIRQFLDLGSGVPGEGSPHDLGGLARPAVRVVHVDHDPGVIERARLVTAGTEARYLLCLNASDVSDVVSAVMAGGMLDERLPTGVVAVGLLHLIPREDRPHDLLPRYSAELASESMFAASHLTRWHGCNGTAEVAELVGGAVHPREQREFASMFGGLALVKPGVVALPHEWGTRARRIGSAPVLAAIAVKE